METTPHDEQSKLQQRRELADILRPLFFVAILAATVGIIIYLKNATTGPLSPSLDSKDQLVAHPDTSSSDEASRVIAATSAPAVEQQPVVENDTIDHRTPYDAGYEDGYNTGYLDGHEHDWQLNYDASSSYTSDDDNNTYRAAYDHGYQVGFEAGKSGKTFSILNAATSEEEEETADEETADDTTAQ